MNIFNSVEKNYKENFENLKDKRFHFASRLFLWASDEFSKEKLALLKNEYIGRDEAEYFNTIKEILNSKDEIENVLYKNERKKFFIKYPFLKRYNKILFKNLFCKTIYNIDIKTAIQKQIKLSDFLKLRDELLLDIDAIGALSTHAINYLYALDFYLKKDANINPECFIDIVKKATIFKDKKTASLRVYLLTHCIIGESAFYSRPIMRNKKIYCDMILIIEKIINDEYMDVTLDNKVEFLVCVKLCEMKTYLEDRILADLMDSFDDKCALFLENKNKKTANAFRKGEHRNVLALMAFHFKEKN